MPVSQVRTAPFSPGPRCPLNSISTQSLRVETSHTGTPWRTSTVSTGTLTFPHLLQRRHPRHLNDPSESVPRAAVRETRRRRHRTRHSVASRAASCPGASGGLVPRSLRHRVRSVLLDWSVPGLCRQLARKRPGTRAVPATRPTGLRSGFVRRGGHCL